MFSPFQNKSFQDATMIEMSAGRIMITDYLSIGPDLLYEIRRVILKTLKNSEIDRLIQISKDFIDYHYEIRTNNNNEFSSAYYLTKNIKIKLFRRYLHC